ncbi:SdpI family protein [Corynebacterium kalinowskii]|uniref:SdpI family protein n=1 Tax=Corynebacterium kalinowskii TaxID=2675216 RepID=UPI0012E1AD35|nr:SdpI family protein [Corynebacterium kalinowskii]
MTILSIVVLILAAALLVVGGLATARRLPGNPLIGLKVPEVRKSKEAWDVSHAVAGPMWVAAGVSLLFGGLVGLRLSTLLALIFLALTIFVAAVFLGIGANNGAKAAHLMDRQHKDEGCGEDCNCGSEEPKPEVDVAALRKAMNQR